jgi:hypothetical protein
MNNSDREGLISQNGDRPLDDLASARLIAGAGIVLPSVDHSLRLCSVGAAPALPLRLLRAADVFDARLDRFLAMSSLPLLHNRRESISVANSPRWRHRHYRPIGGDTEVR